MIRNSESFRTPLDFINNLMQFSLHKISVQMVHRGNNDPLKKPVIMFYALKASIEQIVNRFL